MAEQLDHVVRSAPPWREASAQTECGRPVTDVASALSRDAMIVKVRQQGKQRAAMSSCMTCWSAATRHKTWDEDPVDAIRRETQYGARTEALFREELRAIAVLVAAHADEFAELLAGLRTTVNLDEVRRRRAARGSRGVS